MNSGIVNPVKLIGRFFLATLAAAASEFVVNAALAPFNSMKGSVDAAFWRLFIGSAVLVGNAMVFFIAESRYHGMKLFGLGLLAYVGAAQLLAHVETVAFNFMFKFGTRELVFLVVSQALTALGFVPLAMLVAGKWKTPLIEIEARTGAFPSLELRPLLIRLALLGVLWYFCYMFAGYFIADPITHDYYAAKNSELGSINSWLPILQFFRGLAWTGLVILGVKIMNRPLQESGILVGLVYGVFHAAGLLLPNEFMPTEMRLAHFPEIVLSLAMFAGLAVSVTAYRKKESRRG